MLRRPIAIAALVSMLVGGCQSLVVPSPARVPPSPSSLAPMASVHASTALSPTAVDWAALARAVRIAQLAPGAPCPRSSGHQVSSDFGIALGDGPVYPVGLEGGVLSTVARDGMYLQKVLWVSAPSYQGPVLIRGTRLDGPGVVQFSTGGSVPTTEFKLPEPGATNAGEQAAWRDWPSYTTVPELGCYAYQVDGTSFTTVVVFEARLGT